MSIATVTSKGQVTLPKDVRDRLHLETGGKIDFRVDDDSGTATLVPLNKSVDEVFGILENPRRKKTAITTEQMQQALRMRFKRKYE